MRHLILLSGHTCSGKSELAQQLRETFGFHVIRTQGLLSDEAVKRGVNADRLSLQSLGDILDQETDSRWVKSAIVAAVEQLPPDADIVVDNIRNSSQLAHFREEPGWRPVHVHLWAPLKDRERRFADKSRENAKETAQSYQYADLIKDEADIEHFKKDADIRIHTAWLDPRDMLIRVAAPLGLYAPPDLRCVDVIVGGQYGSEGKGHVAAYLSREYDVLMRVGGPNAGHTVSSESGVYTYHHLPSGCRDTDAEVLLGPGMTIRVDEILKEIDDCKLEAGRLFIDSQAMIIEDTDIADETELKAKIASTGRGGGAAAARRILGRKPGAIRLAKDVPELLPYVGSTMDRLEKAYGSGRSVLLEGTQGSGLSLYHGPHPYVTSRDTNVAGCLAEAGISPRRVRRVLLVIRPTPIRVGNPDGGVETSGPLKYETTFAEVAALAGLDPSEVTDAEKTSTTRRPRRVGWFEWELFRKSCALNAPTDIVLTFADYLKATNREARRFEQLDQDTIKFIEDLERVAHAPVSLINTRFPRKGESLDLRTVIDRRNWGSYRPPSG